MLHVNGITSGCVPLPRDVLRSIVPEGCGRSQLPDASQVEEILFKHIRAQIMKHGRSLAIEGVSKWPAILERGATEEKDHQYLRGDASDSQGDLVHSSVLAGNHGAILFTVDFETYRNRWNAMTDTKPALVNRLQTKLQLKESKTMHRVLQKLLDRSLATPTNPDLFRVVMEDVLDLPKSRQGLYPCTLQGLVRFAVILHNSKNSRTVTDIVLDSVQQTCCLSAKDADADADADAETPSVTMQDLPRVIEKVMGITAAAAKYLLQVVPKVLVAHHTQDWDVNRTLHRILDAAMTLKVLPDRVQRQIKVLPSTSPSIVSARKSRKQLLAAFRIGFQDTVTMKTIQEQGASTTVTGTDIVGGAMQMLRAHVLGLPWWQKEDLPVCWCWAHKRGFLDDRGKIRIPSSTEVDIATWLEECLDAPVHDMVRNPAFLFPFSNRHHWWKYELEAEKTCFQYVMLLMPLGNLVSKAGVLCGDLALLKPKAMDPTWRQFVLFSKCTSSMYRYLLPARLVVMGLTLQGTRMWRRRGLLCAPSSNTTTEADAAAAIDPPTAVPGTCVVCMEGTQVYVPTCGHAGHALCQECLQTKVLTHSRDWLGLSEPVCEPLPVSPFTCPVQPCAGMVPSLTPGTRMDEELPRQVVSAIALERQGAMHCAGCGFSVHRPVHEMGAGVVKCDACSSRTCVRCADLAHPGILCRASQPLNPTDILSLAKAQPCPNAGCRVPTTKLSGCNHMRCNKCGQHWCWSCGQAVTTMEEHFRDVVGRQGAACSMSKYSTGQEHARMERYIRDLIVTRPECTMSAAQALAMLHSTYAQSPSDL